MTDVAHAISRGLPRLAGEVRDLELRRVQDGLTLWLSASGGPGSLDPSTVSTILMGAVSHYWIMTDVFGGEHPLRTNEDDFLDVLADMAAFAVGRSRSERSS